MTDELGAQRVLPPGLANNIRKIDHATFVAQWGAGDQRAPDEARFVAQNAKRVIYQLQESTTLR